MKKTTTIKIIKLLFLAFIIITSTAVTIDAIINGSNL